MKYPDIISSRTKKEFKFAKYSISLLDHIESSGSSQYRYILAVFKDDADTPCFCITSEKKTTTGIPFLGVFDGDKPFWYMDTLDEYADEQKFTEEAFRIIRERFKLDNADSEVASASGPINHGQVDLKISVDGTNLPKVGGLISYQSIQSAGFKKPGFILKMMVSNLKTASSDVVYFRKNCFIQCHRFDDCLEKHERFGITANTDIGASDMWGNSIFLVVDVAGCLKKLVIQIIMNRGIAEVNLQQFRQLATKAFGLPNIDTEEMFMWQDGETSIVSTRNGSDAIFDWSQL